MNDDTISRQSVLNILLYFDASQHLEMIKKLPSAQPETHEKRTETRACDLISRQAAVDAICKACANGDDYVNCRDRDIKSRWCDNITALRDLPSAPSAQSETEHTMEEFMYGQDMGNPEDGSL